MSIRLASLALAGAALVAAGCGRADGEKSDAARTAFGLTAAQRERIHVAPVQSDTFSPAVEVRNGDDCFVRFTQPHETTFKRVFFEADKKIRLQPRNEQYSPTIMDGKRIDGIYRAIIRYERL